MNGFFNLLSTIAKILGGIVALGMLSILAILLVCLI